MAAESALPLEEMVRVVHEARQRARLAVGKRGPGLEESLHQHSSLIPDAQAQPSERDYELETARQFLQLGYRIVRVEATGDTGIVARKTAFEAAREELAAARTKRGTLLSLWRRRDPAVWQQAPDLYRLAAELLRPFGEFLVAIDVASEGLTLWKADVRLQQLLASALISSGAPCRANELLLELRAQGAPDEQTLGLLASSYKQLALRASDPVKRRAKLRSASEHYWDAYKRFGRNIWPGINTATLLFLRGERTRGDAITIARAVRKRCDAEVPKTSDREQEYWLWATLAETWLLEGQMDAAADAYAKAVAVADGLWGRVRTTAGNAKLILDALPNVGGEERRLIESILRGPAVALFCGLMIDLEQVRFPQSAAAQVKQAIREELDVSGARVGYASAACGSDLLFLEAMLERGGEVHVVLPYGREQFRKDAVGYASPEWGERFDAVLGRANDVIEASHQRLAEGAASLRYASLLLHGLAHLQADQWNAPLVPIAVWDGRESLYANGVSAQIAQWKETHLDVKIIRLDELLKSPAAQQQVLAEPSDLPRLDMQGENRIVGLLFADAKNFSKLGEQQVASFVEHFMGMVGDVVRGADPAPRLKNTWGDGLFVTFDSVRDAGLFALRLCEAISESKWSEYGLPEDLSLRIGLHAGPVVCAKDPVTGTEGMYGTHISHAARIEPSTPAGEVYASRAFAALAAAEGVGDFICEYVGQVDLAKKHGVFPMFRIQRSQPGGGAKATAR